MNDSMMFDNVLVFAIIFVITEDRNNLEKLTLAVLTHLPTAVLYVHDLTGECGTSPSDQVYLVKNNFLWSLHQMCQGSTGMRKCAS